jgi:hypothetical protein
MRLPWINYVFKQVLVDSMDSAPQLKIPFERDRFEDPFPCSDCDKDKVYTRIYVNKKLGASKWLCYNCAVDYRDRDSNWECAYVPVTINYT